jgi:hypothetical protein
MENDFTFIVGERHYHCPHFMAAFLSPRVARLHAIDPSVSQFIIETVDSNEQFDEFLALGRGSGLNRTDANHLFLSAIACELCNFELYFAIDSDSPDHALISTFWDQLPGMEVVDYIPHRWIDYIASHFFELDSSLLKQIPVSILGGVLSNQSLRIWSEDSLYDLLRSRFDCDSNSLELLQYIRFDFLTCESMLNFISWSSDNFDKIDFSISLWGALCRRLSFGISVFPGSIAEYRATRLYSLSFPLSFVAPLDGISHI